MAEKKYSTLALLKVLEEYTDQDHILSLRQLQDRIESRSGLKLDRRTIYSNLEILEQNGYVISKFDDNWKNVSSTRVKSSFCAMPSMPPISSPPVSPIS